MPGIGGPRSEGTRRAILQAARSMFAARGFEQTTIRAVAAEADVDASGAVLADLHGILYFYSVDLQQYHHDSTLAAGLAVLPMTILMAVLGPVAGRLSARFSTTPVMIAGLLIAAAGALSLALLPASGSALDLGWRFALIGLGTIVAAGHHAPAGAVAFQAGLGHAFLAVAALLGLCAVAVAVLGRGENRRHGRHQAP